MPVCIQNVKEYKTIGVAHLGLTLVSMSGLQTILAEKLKGGFVSYRLNVLLEMKFQNISTLVGGAPWFDGIVSLPRRML